VTSDPVPVPVILYRRRDTRKMSTRRCGVVCLQYPRAQTGRWHITLKFFPMKNPPLRCGLYQITLDSLVVVIITGRIQQISLLFSRPHMHCSKLHLTFSIRIMPNSHCRRNKTVGLRCAGSVNWVLNILFAIIILLYMAWWTIDHQSVSVSRLTPPTDMNNLIFLSNMSV